jgi:mannose-1-phosphate guanylyltransferase/mannose-1-phosphate guanylyltransferase/mannose-6-phosphate isomerase
MLRLTLARTHGLGEATPPIIVANGAHTALIESDLSGEATIILEPFARNTAPAIALAALLAPDPGASLLVMPSDHAIADVEAFQNAIARARPLADEGWLITFGITPDGPETGFGYIALGETLADGARQVARFVEKPDLAKAKAMLAAGNHVWNAGIFMFRADVFLQELSEFRPDILAACEEAAATSRREGHSILPGASAFEQCPSDSIDYAVMERATKVACVPVDMGWSDVGSWDTLHDIATKDAEGNSANSQVTLIESQNCLVRSSGGLNITLVGVKDLIVVAHDDEILIVPRGQSQLVKKAAEAAMKRAKGEVTK